MTNTVWKTVFKASAMDEANSETRRAEPPLLHSQDKTAIMTISMPSGPDRGLRGEAVLGICLGVREDWSNLALPPFSSSSLPLRANVVAPPSNPALHPSQPAHEHDEEGMPNTHTHTQTKTQRRKDTHTNTPPAFNHARTHARTHAHTSRHL